MIKKAKNGHDKNKFGQLIDASLRPFFYQMNSLFSEFKKKALPTDRPTNRRTDGRTVTLIEMRGGM